MTTTGTTRESAVARWPEGLEAIVREELAVAAPDLPSDVAGSDHLRHDLDVDSLAVLELVARLECRLGVVVDDADWERMTSIDMITEYLDDTLRR